MLLNEQEFAVNLDDGHMIHGLLRRSDADAPLVLIIHGLTGHMNEHLHFVAARELQKNNFNVVRFNLYSEEDEARRLDTTTPTQHVADTEAVIRFLRSEFGSNKLFLIGHSMGGVVRLWFGSV